MENYIVVECEKCISISRNEMNLEKSKENNFEKCTIVVCTTRFQNKIELQRMVEFNRTIFGGYK